jgi:hypothetical protein
MNMAESAQLANPVLLYVWGRGRPVEASELKGQDGPTLPRVRALLSAGLLQRTLLSRIYCPEDGEQLLTVDNASALTCSRCGLIIELGKSEFLEYYSLHVDYARITACIVDSFKAHGFELSGETSFPANRDISQSGVLHIGADSTLALLVAKRVVTPATLLQAWGHCSASSQSAILVHPGLAPTSEQYLRLSFQSSPICPVLATDLSLARPFESARSFTRFRREIQARLTGLESIVFGADGGAQPTDIMDPFGPEDDELATSGGATYEPTALKLLSILGPTLKFSRRAGVRQVPDGILLLPDGVWILDAKSASDSFHYRQEQRDQTWRYLSTIEQRSDYFRNSWKFYGEIIVTRTDPLLNEELKNARDDLRARGTTSVVTIVSHEGLRRLWTRASANPEYWQRRMLSEDPRDVLLLRQRFLSDSRVDKNTVATAESPLRVVTSGVLDSYWDRVLANPYQGLSARQPADVLSGIEEMFIRDYGH